MLHSTMRMGQKILKIFYPRTSRIFKYLLTGLTTCLWFTGLLPTFQVLYGCGGALTRTYTEKFRRNQALTTIGAIFDGQLSEKASNFRRRRSCFIVHPGLDDEGPQIVINDVIRVEVEESKCKNFFKRQ